MNPARGKLQGEGVIKDKDGNIKGRFVIDAEVPPGQEAAAERLADTVESSQEKQDNGDNPPNHGP